MRVPAKPLLAVDGLTKAFGGVRAISGVSFTIRAGAVHSIIGPNGAGKTTLLNLLTGVYVPDAGRIALEGRDLAGEPAHRFAAAGIARTFQNLQVFFNMTAAENVMTGRHLRERCSLAAAMLRTPALVRAEAQCRAVARELLRRVGVERYEDVPAAAMPYGALKRLEIARALALEPSLLLLDEPAAGLNPTEAREIDTLLEGLAADATTVVLVEHNMRLVMEVSDHVLVLDEGRVLAEGAPEEVARDPRVVEAYLGAAPSAATTGAEAIHA
ncbi:MAG: ABC transporter ATP-binding protein [Burkholderiales bacterium]|nr:ABC transporter ATP-binding protein [Burkholderiales bacterium]